VQSGGQSSTGELLTNFCYSFTIIGVVTFTICFYKEEVERKHGEGFNYEEDPIDDSGGRKASIDHFGLVILSMDVMLCMHVMNIVKFE
jgi:hypothetical protein